MDQTRSFPLADVLSVTTDRLLSRRHMAGLYDLLGFMTGQDVYTHQLGTAADAAAPALMTQHPFLADLLPPDGSDPADLMAWLVNAEREHGENLAVTPLKDWKQRDPIEGACDAVGAEKVFVVPMDPR
ncbi:hypothetical protein ACFVZH_02675 [Streptomyces sp. NPDC059534]|uniref:DUF7736 domain-containing protein n=1 Tax=Streptomyces sp. NPDC059534 TaxID=3346859 RepID=UPI0036C72740